MKRSKSIRSDSWLSKIDSSEWYGIMKEHAKGGDVLSYIKKKFNLDVSRSAYYRGFSWLRANEPVVSAFAGLARNPAHEELLCVKSMMQDFASSLSRIEKKLKAIEKVFQK